MKNNRNTKPEVTITGVIVPDEWDNRSNITSIVISTTFEDEYTVLENTRRHELMNHLNRQVRVSGQVFTENRTGQKSILVKDYTIIAT